MHLLWNLNQKWKQRRYKMNLWKKDMDIIGSFAKELGVIAPLFEASAGLYTKGLEDGRDKQDTASVCAVLAEMAGLDRSK